MKPGQLKRDRVVELLGHFMFLDVGKNTSTRRKETFEIPARPFGDTLSTSAPTTCSDAYEDAL
jgi:hypothetical protein